jgi:hypothetical protein
MEESDLLERFGGLILIGLGISLIVLATVFADEEAVASIFAFTGVASAVLGVVLARIEGPFELSATGLKATLRNAHTVIQREDWTSEQKLDVLIQLLTKAQAGPLAEGADVGATLNVATGQAVVESPVDRGRRFERAVQQHLESKGCSVSEASARDIVADFVAECDGKRFLVEAKARQRLNAADVQDFAGMARSINSIDQFKSATLALAVPRGSLTAGAREEFARAGADIKLIEVDFPA